MDVLNSPSESMAALAWAALFLAFSLQIVISDFKYRRVSNNIILFVLALQTIWLVGSFLQSKPATTWNQVSALSLIGASIFYLVILFPFWMRNILGGGDVKYIATLAYLVGLEQAFYLILAGSVVMSLYAMLLLSLKKVPALYSFVLSQSDKHLPYAGCIALVALSWAILKITP